jgi:hypothetical protein
MTKKQVYVVETWLPSHWKWHVWSAHTMRNDAWAAARYERERYPKYKFRVTAYASTKQ